MSNYEYIPSNAKQTRFGSRGIILRAHEGNYLTIPEIQAKVPSVFAEEKHSSRSEKYSFIPTLALLQKMQEEGFFPVEVRQGGNRDVEKRNFTKHLLKFRRQGVRAILGDTFPEATLINSHDGTSSWYLPCSWFRFTCANGAYVPDREGVGIRASHRGNIDDVIEASYKVVENFTSQAETIEQMDTIQLTGPEQELFAQQAASLRWDSDHSVRTADILYPRRKEDVGNSLWLTFNRTQETITQGLVDVQTRDVNGYPTRRRARAVNNIGDNIKLNQALFALAEGMKNLKLGIAA